MEARSANPGTVQRYSLMSNCTENINTEIDAVIAWVDGNDPNHASKMASHLSKGLDKHEDIAGPTRFRSVGEITYCVASILRFAPFIRNIFIITDNQRPDLKVMMDNNFPDKWEKIKIIDHRELYEGAEHQLPVFNSMSIETVTWKIKGLSENYLYFNDDFFLLRPTEISDWFVDDKIIAYGDYRSILLDGLVSWLKPKKNGKKPLGYKDTLMAAAKTLGKKNQYFHFEHTPHPLKRSIFKSYFEEHPEVFEKNRSFKFRDPLQFNPQSLYYLLMLEMNRAIIKKPKLLYMKPVGRGKGYIPRKINYFEKDPSIKFACFGSMDLAREEDVYFLLDWLKKQLSIVLD